jgi:hypothetical protein
VTGISYSVGMTALAAEIRRRAFGKSRITVARGFHFPNRAGQGAARRRAADSPNRGAATARPTVVRPSHTCRTVLGSEARTRNAFNEAVSYSFIATGHGHRPKVLRFLRHNPMRAPELLAPVAAVLLHASTDNAHVVVMDRRLAEDASVELN